MLWVQIPRSSKEFFNKALESGVFLFIKLPLLQTDTTKYDITLAIERLFYFKRDVRKGVFPFITPISGAYNKKEFSSANNFFSYCSSYDILYFGLLTSYPILKYSFFLIPMGYLGRNLTLNSSLVFKYSDPSTYVTAYLSLTVIIITNVFLGDCNCLTDMSLLVDYFIQ